MAEKSKRGFGRMSPEKQRAIASKGGQASHKKGVAHEFTLEEARKAGHLGGKVIGANREHMAAIGRKGGQRTASGHRISAATQHQEKTLTQQAASSVSPRATDLLRMDHHVVQELFHRQAMITEADEARVALMQQICAELETHAQLEEEIFYPAVKARVDDDKQKKIEEGVEEHQQIKDLVAQIRRLAVYDASFLPTRDQLRTCVEHHIQEEEQEILPVAEERLHEEIVQLGQQLQQRKQELTGHTTTSRQPLPPTRQEVISEPLPSEQNGQGALSESPLQNEYSNETSH